MKKGQALTSSERLEARRVSVELECDPRSVEKVMRGEEVRGLLGERIQRALKGKRR